MKVIAKGRQGGKTTEAIALALETNSYLVVADLREWRRIQRFCKEKKSKIPNMMTFTEFSSKRYFVRGINGFVIDNVDMLLQHMSPVPIQAITVSL